MGRSRGRVVGGCGRGRWVGEVGRWGRAGRARARRCREVSGGPIPSPARRGKQPTLAPPQPAPGPTPPAAHPRAGGWPFPYLSGLVTSETTNVCWSFESVRVSLAQWPGRCARGAAAGAAGLGSWSHPRWACVRKLGALGARIPSHLEVWKHKPVPRWALDPSWPSLYEGRRWGRATTGQRRAISYRGDSGKVSAASVCVQWRFGGPFGGLVFRVQRAARHSMRGLLTDRRRHLHLQQPRIRRRRSSAWETAETCTPASPSAAEPPTPNSRTGRPVGGSGRGRNRSRAALAT